MVCSTLLVSLCGCGLCQTSDGNVPSSWPTPGEMAQASGDGKGNGNFVVARGNVCDSCMPCSLWKSVEVVWKEMAWQNGMPAETNVDTVDDGLMQEKIAKKKGLYALLWCVHVRACLCLCVCAVSAWCLVSLSINAHILINGSSYNLKVTQIMIVSRLHAREEKLQTVRWLMTR